MNRRVLIVTYYWPPSGGSGVQRWVKFAKYLSQFEVDPVVLTVSNPTYASLDESLEADVPDSISVYKSRSIEPFGLYSLLAGKSKAEVAKPSTQIESGTSLISRMASWIRANVFVPDARIGWIPSARKQALQLVREHHISTVITTGPPHSTHLIGKYLKGQTAVKWIADFRDPWTRIFYNESLNRSGLAASIDLKLEQSVLETADEVIVTAPSMKSVQAGITDRTYTYIPNGFDPEDFNPGTRSQPAENTENDMFTVRHIGTLPESSVPYGLFEAMSHLDEDLKLRLELIGNVHPEVQRLIEMFNLHDRVSMRPYVPHHEAIELMQSADLLLLIIPDTSQNSNIIPGKLFEYLGSGRPIMSIGARTGDAATIVESQQRGMAFDHADVHGQEQFLRKALQGSPDYRQLSASDKPGYDHPYSRFALTKQLHKLIVAADINKPHKKTNE